MFLRRHKTPPLITAARRTSSTAKTPLTLKHAEIHPIPSTVQLFSWGRGASGQLGGGIEEIRLYPATVASLLLPPTFSLSVPVPGRVPVRGNGGGEGVGISCGLFHSAVMVDGECWIWGKGDGGRLGFGHEDPVYVPRLNAGVESVRSVALGGLHSVALDSLGRVFTWSVCVLLGSCYIAVEIPVAKLRESSVRDCKSHQELLFMGITKNSCFYLVQGGNLGIKTHYRVFRGYGGFGALGHSVYHKELLPRLVEGSWNEEISHIATSGTHTAAITKTGELYTWGRDEGDGRLGLGPGRGPNEAGGLSIPSKIKSLPVSVAAVSCGGFFTMALTEEGKLWNWGANSNYELGRGDKIGGWKPQLNHALEDFCIVQVASGGYHSLALTDKGQVFSWGHGGHGQLGNSSQENQKVPVPVEALANEKVVFIACGGSSSAAITDKGKLFMWGNAKDCQLGVPGLPEIQTSPVEVKFLNENDGLGAHHVLSVAIGASHAMCLVSRSGC